MQTEMELAEYVLSTTEAQITRKLAGAISSSGRRGEMTN